MKQEICMPMSDDIVAGQEVTRPKKCTSLLSSPQHLGQDEHII